MSDDIHQRHRHVSISTCPGGCVRLQFGMTLVHLPPGDFQAFVTLPLQALPDIESRRDGAPPSHARGLT